ncbi:MAG: hypothetical protein K2J15_00195, partial [Muribaculaceae bacterium]|nr:hypothetical protein [Muribaculaceae bacterium]
MKRFISWFFVVVLTVCVVDILFGLFFNNYIKKNVLPGDYESVEKVLRNNDAEILVLGSSVALNSINTKAVEDSTGLITFNAGGNGQTFPFFLTMLKAAIKQKIPAKVILCVNPNVFASDGLGNRYNLLAPYYGLGISDIDKNLSLNRKYDKYLLNITSYRLNNIWFRILMYHFISPDLRGENGYIGKPVPPVFPNKLSFQIKSLSQERCNELEEFLRVCSDNKIDLTIVFTPLYNDIIIANKDQNVLSQVTALAEKYKVRVFNDIELEPFASDSTLFYDNTHININGTDIYT